MILNEWSLDYPDAPYADTPYAYGESNVIDRNKNDNSGATRQE